MTLPSDNPFASPALTSSANLEQFQVSDKEVAARESFQAVIAGILFLLFLALWVPLLIATGATAPWFLQIFPALIVLSCLATVFNHHARARRAWQRLPVVLDESGLTAKFRHGKEWVPREIPWPSIRKVRFRKGIATVELADSTAELTADWSILGRTRIERLKKVLQHYTDQMAGE